MRPPAGELPGQLTLEDIAPEGTPAASVEACRPGPSLPGPSASGGPGTGAAPRPGDRLWDVVGCLWIGGWSVIEVAPALFPDGPVKWFNPPPGGIVCIVQVWAEDEATARAVGQARLDRDGWA